MFLLRTSTLRPVVETPPAVFCIHIGQMYRHILGMTGYAELIVYNSQPDSLFYLDPSYWRCTDDYGANIFSETDFTVLRDLLATTQGRFVLSINDVSAIRDLFSGFDIEEVDLNYRVSGKVTPAKELIISN